MRKRTLTNRHKQSIFVILITICLATNLFYLIPHLRRSVKKRAQGPYRFYGHFFTEIKDKLKKVRFMGYCTDKDLDERNNSAIFTQAQYELAPIILVPNSLNYNYIFFSYKSEEKAIAIIRKIKATPLVRNNLDILLAEKRPWYY
jgi:hypothetical protein